MDRVGVNPNLLVLFWPCRHLTCRIAAAAADPRKIKGIILIWRFIDDLRFYLRVQFFPGLAVVLLFLLCSPKYSGMHYWILAEVLYASCSIGSVTGSRAQNTERANSSAPSRCRCRRSRQNLRGSLRRQH